MEEITNAKLSVYPIEGFSDGLTKRELFAAMAMQGMLANRDWTENSKESIADWSIRHADALLKELDK